MRQAKSIIAPDGAVVTVGENRAKAIALQVREDAERHYAPRKFKSLSLVELAPFAWGRGQDALVMRELIAMQNRELY